MAFDAFALQHTMKPEAVETRFLNDDDRKGFSGPLRRLPLELRKARQQRRDVSCSHGMLRHFLAGARRQRCDQPDGAAEFQRDETGGKMSLDSGLRFGALRYAWHGRLLSDWSQPHSARALVAILLPMGSINSEQRSETADGVARESEGRTRLLLLRPLRQDQPRGYSGACLRPVPLQQGRTGCRRTGLRGHRGVRGRAVAW